MSYDPNSLETQKGKLGEKIIRRFYDERSAIVQRPDGLADGQASLIDFHVKPYGNSTIEEHLAEVKVRNAMQYAFGRYPCYTIPVAQLGLYKQYASDRDLPLILWIVDPKAGKMYSGELAPWGLENPTSIDGKEFPFDQQTKCGNMRFYHREQFIEYPLDERDIRAFEELEGNYAAKSEVPESELEQRCVGYFGKPFPEGVRAGLQEIQQEFSDDDIFNAICALADNEDSDVLLERVLAGANSPVITNLFLRHVRANISKPAKGTENEPERPAFTSNTNEKSFVAQTWTAPNGTLIEEVLPPCTDTGTRYIQWLHLGQAIGYKKEPSLTTQETLSALSGIRLVTIPTQVTFRGCERTVLRQCIGIADVPAFLERYIEATYGARQGSTKYNRHMEATRLAVWWKNVVLQEEEFF